MLNPFFQQGSFGEQGLIQDLINEQLKIYGIDVYYIPRKYITKKSVIKEVIESKFDNAYPIEAYVDNYDGYGGNGTILSKFGIQELDDLTLIISRERFENYISPLIKNLPNIELSTRPKEGDLIYFPLGDRLFEIKYVEHEKPFYQLQKNYVYELRCELFRYEDEDIDTGIDHIDDNIVEEGYIQTLTLVGSGVTATAITSIVNGGVRFIRVTNRGNGYTSIPQVAISSAPFGGINAVGVATMISNLVDCIGIKSSRIQGVQLTNPGAGYTLAPNIVFIGGGGSGAAATSVIGDGLVGIITVTNGGSGYTTSPTVTFSSPGIGTTAVGYAVVGSSGSVTQIRILDAGIGYTSIPSITIESPYTSGIGTYKFNEEIVGSISGTTAKVKSWNSITNELKVSIISGTFVSGEVVTGQDSGAAYKLRILNTNNIVDPYADNDNIEELADTIIDFSESNPFGMP
jgi:hypothetical protein